MRKTIILDAEPFSLLTEATSFPVFSKEDFEARISALRSHMKGDGIDFVVLYADREHFANMFFFTGYDPRFEEALLIIAADENRIPTLVLGNEGYDYSFILCEKAFTRTAEEARSVLALAAEKKLLVTEAIWPRYMPMAQTLREFSSSGKLGKIRALTCNLGYPVSHVARIKDPALAGGALLDVGVYTLNFAALILGRDIRKVSSCACFSDRGVDLQGSATIGYGDGSMASVFFSVLSPTDRLGAIYGEIGYALVENINNFISLRVFDSDHNLVEEIMRPPQLTGFEYELTAAIDAIRQGLIECPQMPHSETIFIMELMDEIRRKW